MVMASDWKNFVARFATWRSGAWFIVTMLFRLDGALMKISRGRVFLAGGWDMLLLTTIGAKSGAPRAIPLLYIRDGKNILLVASNGGREKFPAWYWNLRAHPHAQVVVNGETKTYLAHEARGSEYARAWHKAVWYFNGYAAYRERIKTRVIPVMVLTPQTRKEH